MNLMNLTHVAFFVLLLGALLGAISEMTVAVDEADVQSFSIWTSIAFVIAGIPIFLW